jgi:hypothetical protein
MSAHLEPELTSASRRALLAGALGGIGAWAVSAIGRPNPARAADGQTVLVGGEYTSSSVTRFSSSTSDDGLRGDSSGFGVHGTSPSGYGVFGESSNVGVRGEATSGYGVSGESTSSIGVAGTSSATTQPAVRGWGAAGGTGVLGVSGGTIPAAKAKTGVYGYAAQDASSNGVWGESISGSGVYGTSDSGYGVYGISSSTSGVYGASSSGAGLFGVSVSYVGVYAYSDATTQPGSLGWSGGNSSGLQGVSGDSVPAPKAKTGVYGYANQDSTAKGVFGESVKGYAGYFAGRVYVSKYQEMAEIAAPTAPAANKARLFLKDNGSGKTQLCVRFNSGAIQVLATQP